MRTDERLPSLAGVTLAEEKKESTYWWGYLSNTCKENLGLWMNNTTIITC